MFKPKQKHIVFLICAAVFVLSLAAIASAFTRPNNITMDYVPQNYGIYDTTYGTTICGFMESDCRYCHGTTTAWRHHATELAVRGQCVTCHDPACFANPYTSPERDCKQCHIDGACINVDIGKGAGNLGKPHHNSALAGAGRCTACHPSDVVSDLNAIEPPQWDPTTITPTPYSCENCHWPSDPTDHVSTPPLADWNKWSSASSPRPTTWPDSLPHPQRIDANGPMNLGVLNAGKSYLASDPTLHHDIDGAIFYGAFGCSKCHATSEGGSLLIPVISPPENDPNWAYQIRGCENCHDIYTLHNGIGGEHTTNGIGGNGIDGGYTVFGATNQVVVTNQKCVACHGDDVSGPMPVDPGPASVVDRLQPPMASPGVIVTITSGENNAALGGNNNSICDPGETCNTFGTEGEDDAVVLQQGSLIREIKALSWNSDKITFEMPGGVFTPGGLYISVKKVYWAEDLFDGIGDDDTVCDSGEVCSQVPKMSNTRLFAMRQHPILSTLVPDSGTWGTQEVTINAQTGSFFSLRERVFVDGADGDGLWGGYGYSTYIELVASNDKYRVTEMSGDGWSGGLIPWFDASIEIRLAALPQTGPTVGYGNLYDVSTDLNPTPWFVPFADLYNGNWQLQVVTDYFLDGGVLGRYMLKASDRWPSIGPAYANHLTGQIDPGDTLIFREVSDPLPFFATNTPFISYANPTSVKGNNYFALYGIHFGTTRDTSFVEYDQNCDGSINGTYPAGLYVQWSNTRIVLKAPVVNANGCLRVVVPGVQPPGSDYSNMSKKITIYP